MTELNNHAERAHALLSASSAHRWLACPPSAVAAEAYPDQDTEFTREGTLAHEVAEIYANGDEVDMETATEEIAEQITREMIECAEAYRDYIQEQIKSDDAVVLLEQRVDFSHWVPEVKILCKVSLTAHRRNLSDGFRSDINDGSLGLSLSLHLIGRDAYSLKHHRRFFEIILFIQDFIFSERYIFRNSVISEVSDEKHIIAVRDSCDVKKTVDVSRCTYRRAF